MVKFLISGCLERVEGNSSPWETLVKRIDALQNSSHGPFDCIFVAGPLFEEESIFKYETKQMLDFTQSWCL